MNNDCYILGTSGFSAEVTQYIEDNKISNKNIKTVKKNTYKKQIIDRNDNNLNIVDVCKIIRECNIDEISKYLSKEGMKKKYPDITTKN